MYSPRKTAGGRKQLYALLLFLAFLLAAPAPGRADTTLKASWQKLLRTPRLTVIGIRPALADFIRARTTSYLSRSETELYAQALLELANQPKVPIPVKIEILTASCEIAPWLPEPPTKLCQILFSRGNYLESFSFFWQACQNFVLNRNHKHYIRALSWLGAAFLSLSLLTLVTLLLAGKYFKAIAELARYKLNQTGTLALLCGGLLAGALIVFIPSPLPGLLLLAFMLSLMAVREDKLMLAIVLATTLIAPYAYEQGMLALLAQGTPSLELTNIPASSPAKTSSDQNKVGDLTHRTLELYTQAESARLQGNYQMAAEALEKIIASKIRLAAIYNNLGNLYLLLNQPEKSIRMYQEALKLDSSTGTPYFNLSQAYLRSSFDLEKSALALERALRKSPELNREINNPEVGQQNVMNLIFMPLPYDFYRRYACSLPEIRTIKSEFLSKVPFPKAEPLSYYLFVLITLGAVLVLFWKDPDNQQLCLACGRLFHLPQAIRRQKLCPFCRPGLMGRQHSPSKMNSYLDLLTTIGALLPGFYPFMTNRRIVAFCFFVPLLLWIYNLLFCETGIMAPLPPATNWVRLFLPAIIWGASLILLVKLRSIDNPDSIAKKEK